MKFNPNGYRRRPDGGLTYDAVIEPYAVYHSDQVGGVPVLEQRWLAIHKLSGGAEIVIGRRRSRATAERVCNRHSRAMRAVQREQERAESERLKKKRRTRKRTRQLVSITS